MIFIFKVCEYRAKLSLPHLPDMVFPNNVLMIQGISRPDVKIFFNALDALRMVDAATLPEVQVRFIFSNTTFLTIKCVEALKTCITHRNSCFIRRFGV